jgi:hypothetical protein
MTFDDATRQNFFPLSTQAYSPGGTTNFLLPTSGLGARLWLQFQGTQTNAGVPTTTVTGPYSIIKRLTVRVNSGVTIIDATGYGLSLLAEVTGQLIGSEANIQACAGSTASGQANAYNYAAATASAFNFMLPVPLCWNYRDDIGLVLLQNTRAQVAVQILWNTATGADLTFPYTGGTTVAITGTLTPFLEFFTLPETAALFPDLLIMHKVTEYVQSITSTGDQYVTLQRGNTFTKILHYLYLNGVTTNPTDITRGILRYDQTVRPYELTWATKQIQQLIHYEKWLPNDVWVWDLAWQGIPGMGYFRDTIDSEAVSELTSIINIGPTPTGLSQLNTVTEELIHLEPAAA